MNIPDEANKAAYEQFELGMAAYGPRTAVGMAVKAAAPHIDRAARIDELLETADQIAAGKFHSAGPSEHLEVAQGVAQVIAQLMRSKAAQLESLRDDR